MKTLQDLKNYLIEEADYELIQVNKYDQRGTL